MSTIRCPLREAAEISGSRPALIRDGLVLSYRDYDTCTAVASGLLAKAGIAEGDRVGIFLQTDWTYPVLLMALLRLGAVACPLDVRWPRQRLLQALTTLHCDTLIAANREGEKEKTVSGRRVLNPEFFVTLPSSSGTAGELSPRMDLDRLATILFTSGSSDTGKAVAHTYGNHYYSAIGSNANIHVTSGDRWLLVLPVHHVSGLSILWRCLLGGAAIAMPSVGEELAASLQKYGASHVSVVGTQLGRLMAVKESVTALKRLKAVLAGGSRIAPDLIQRCRQEGIPLHTTYGLTEMASQVTTTSTSTPPSEWITAGQPLRYREIKIGEDDQILVRGETLFKGYVHGDSIHRPSVADGWFPTGDLGEMDDSGYLRVKGRTDHMFISGGENVHPEEIEQVLIRLGDIQDALVVPIPSEAFGQRPVAFLRARKETWARLHQIEQALEEWLPRFKCPVAYFPWPEDEGENGLKPRRADFLQRALSLYAGD